MIVYGVMIDGAALEHDDSFPYLLLPYLFSCAAHPM